MTPPYRTMDRMPATTGSNPGPIRIVTVVGDFYSATRTTFEHPGERIVSGTVIFFNEHLTNPRRRQDAYQAFREAAARRGWRCDTLAPNPIARQAVVRLG